MLVFLRVQYVAATPAGDSELCTERVVFLKQ